MLTSLNGGELFALYASIFLHDVGMAATVDELADPYFAWGTTGKTLRLPLLGVLLRLSDLLHLSNDRTPLPLVQYADLRNARSREEWKKHLATLGVAPIPGHRIVRMTCTCSDPSIHRSILRLCDYVNEEFNYCQEILHLLKQRTGSEATITFDKIEPTIVPDGYEPWLHLHFQFDRAGIFELLKGARLYPSPGAVVKELVINAVDATRQTLRVTGPLHAVDVRFDTSNRILEVADRGPGMNKHEIESYLLQLGKSIYHSDEYLQNYHPPQRIESISEFGIGFASVFAASNHVTVETRKDGEVPILIDMFDLLGFAAAQTETLADRGTIVRLKLKDSEEVLKSVTSAIEELRTKCPHLEMPLKITVDGKTSILEFEPYEHEPKSLLSEYFAGRNTSFQIHYHRFHPDQDDITGVIGLLCTVELAAFLQARVFRSAWFNPQIAPLIDLLIESAPNKVHRDRVAMELMTWNEIRQLSSPIVFYRRWISKSDEDIRREVGAIQSLANNCIVVEHPGGEESFNRFVDIEGIILSDALHRGFQICRAWDGTAVELDERNRHPNFSHLGCCTPFHSESLYAIVSSTITREACGVYGRLSTSHPKIQTMLTWIRQCVEREELLPKTLALLSFINNGYLGQGRDPDYVEFVVAKQRSCLQELSQDLQYGDSAVNELLFSGEDFVRWEINP